MRWIPVTLLPLLLLLAPAPGAAAGKTGKAGKLLTAWFRAEGKADREKALEAIRALDPVSPKEMKDLVKLSLSLAREGPKSTGGAERTVQSGPTKGKYYVVGAGGGGKKGIFIGLHGGGPGQGDARGAQSKWSSASGKGCIAVFPQATRLVHDAWNQLDQEDFVLEMIEELKRTYRIDTNRIYLAGHSMGGFGTWSIGGRHADLFAAISPNSGGPYGTETIDVDVSDRGGPKIKLEDGVLRNLFLLPVRWFHGTADTHCSIENGLEAERQLKDLHETHPDGYEFEFEKIEGMGHSIRPGGLSPIIAWMTKRKRDPYPKKVIWQPWPRKKLFFYWLHIPRPARGATIVAEIRKKREITVDSIGGYLPRLTLFLADELIDAKKEITVVWNGTEKFRGHLTPSVSALAETMFAKRDPEMILTYRIDLE